MASPLNALQMEASDSCKIKVEDGTFNQHWNAGIQL